MAQHVELLVKQLGPAPHARFAQLIQPGIAQSGRVNLLPFRGDGASPVDGF
jgi:hypothetical protein